MADFTRTAVSAKLEMQTCWSNKISQCQNECHLGIQRDKGSRGVSVSKKGEVLDTVPKTLWGQMLVLLHPVYVFSVHLSLFARVFEGRDYVLIFVSTVPSLYLTALQ